MPRAPSGRRRRRRPFRPPRSELRPTHAVCRAVPKAREHGRGPRLRGCFPVGLEIAGWPQPVRPLIPSASATPTKDASRFVWASFRSSSRRACRSFIDLRETRDRRRRGRIFFGGKQRAISAADTVPAPLIVPASALRHPLLVALMLAALRDRAGRVSSGLDEFDLLAEF